jgi:GGDEF domain-containing protein
VLIELDPPGEAVRAGGEPARAQVLEAMGRLLRGGTRAMDASCRYDDNRFAVLLSGVGWPLRIRAWKACGAAV